MSEFNGFEEPKQNWSRLPHSLIENLHVMTSEAEVKLVIYILRHTWGYGDEKKKITLDEFCNGRKKKDGTRIDNGLGLSVNAVKAGIRSAIDHGFICVTEDASDKARIKKYYQLRGSELDCQSLTPDYQKLIPRLSEVDNQPSEVDNRSEKETNRDIPLERNSVPAKKTKDYLVSVVSSIGKVNEDTAPIPEDQWIHYRDAAYESFKNISGALGNNSAERQTRRGLIVGGVAARPDFDIERFERCMTEWIGATGRGENITKIWEVYDAGSYKAYIEKNYPKNQQQNSAPAPRARAYSKEQLEMIERLNKETEMERWRP